MNSKAVINESTLCARNYWAEVLIYLIQSEKLVPQNDKDISVLRIHEYLQTSDLVLHSHFSHFVGHGGKFTNHP